MTLGERRDDRRLPIRQEVEVAGRSTPLHPISPTQPPLPLPTTASPGYESLCLLRTFSFCIIFLFSSLLFSSPPISARTTTVAFLHHLTYSRSFRKETNIMHTIHHWLLLIVDIISIVQATWLGIQQLRRLGSGFRSLT